MAPEVLVGGAVTPKIDVYAFGIVMWELFTFKEPFSHHSNYDQFVKAVYEGERPDLTSNEVQLTIPKGMRDCIAEAWAADPHQRPSMSQMLPSLEVAMISALLPCQTASSMWLTYFKSQTEVEFSKFVSVFFAVLNVDLDSAEYNDYFVCLKTLLVSSDILSTEIVRIEKFSFLLNWFGELLPTTERPLPFMERIHQLLKTSYFYGATSKEATETHLTRKGNATGTYLLRFNMKQGFTEPPFTISKLASASKKLVEHQRILYKKTTGYYTLLGGKEKIILKGEITDVVQQLTSRLGLTAGLTESPYLRLFADDTKGKYIGGYTDNQDDFEES